MHCTSGVLFTGLARFTAVPSPTLSAPFAPEAGLAHGVPACGEWWLGKYSVYLRYSLVLGHLSARHQAHGHGRGESKFLAKKLVFCNPLTHSPGPISYSSWPPCLLAACPAECRSTGGCWLLASPAAAACAITKVARVRVPSRRTYSRTHFVWLKKEIGPRVLPRALRSPF